MNKLQPILFDTINQASTSIVWSNTTVFLMGYILAWWCDSVSFLNIYYRKWRPHFSSLTERTIGGRYTVLLHNYFGLHFAVVSFVLHSSDLHI